MHGLTEQTLKMGGPMPAEQLALRLEHLDLALKVFPWEKRIEGAATLRMTAEARVTELILDLYPNFRIEEIVANGTSLARDAWSNPEGQLRAQLPSPVPAGSELEVTVRYSGYPHVAVRPPWEGGVIWSETADGQPWIASSHWGGGCDLLFPCIDHPTRKPDNADLHITVPAPLAAPANGVLQSVEERDGWNTWHWRARSPHTYGIVLNVGPYEVLEGEYASRYGNSIPMRYWHLPENRARARELFAEFPKVLEFFESRIGPYPWFDQKMGVAETPHNGMEHQTINAYGNDYKKTPYGFDSLLQHEFAHEYFANQVSVANYDDLWIHEGFGSYMQPLYGEYLNGAMDYYAMLKSSRAGIRNEQPLVTRQERSEQVVYFDEEGPRGDIYSKGSLILHTLRQLIGDDDFFEAVRILVYGRADPRPGNFSPQFRTTGDFLDIVNGVTGEDLSWFFDVYFYQAKLPVLETRRNGERVEFRWVTEGGRPFPMPLEVLAGDELRLLPMKDNRGSLRVPEGTPVLVDPDSTILRHSDAIEAYREWRASQEEESRR